MRRTASIKFDRPALYDQLLRIETELAELKGVSVRFRYRLYSDTRPEPIATGETRHACTDVENKVRRMPEAIRTRLAVEYPAP
jgi:acyl-CoA thioester hydrolase